MATFRLLMVSMSDWSMNCHIFSTLRDLEDNKANKRNELLMYMSVQHVSIFELVSVCVLKPESGQKFHDTVVVSHVPTAFSHVD